MAKKWKKGAKSDLNGGGISDSIVTNHKADFKTLPFKMTGNI